MSDKQHNHEIGLIGLAVMGENLALNIAHHGFPIAVWNRTTSKVDAFVANRVTNEPITGTHSLAQLSEALAPPRKIILMVKAGSPVDATIEGLLPVLDEGDLIIDAGNSHPYDTQRRAQELRQKGFHFMGMGVSGGEEGALHGPSMMPGGDAEDYEALEPILTAIAAQTDDGPCVTHVGPGAAGHFVKSVHNGIEYGDMQLIAEVYDVMKTVLRMEPKAIGDVFARWNEGPLESFLIEITAKVLHKDDPETGKPMVDMILDRAMQKGTGRWTSEIALEQGVPLPTIQAAVDARTLSSRKDARERAAGFLKGPSSPPPVDDKGALVDALHDALYAAKVQSYAQGFDLMRVMSEANDWNIRLDEIARIWKGGCIIRARFLDEIKQAYRANPALESLVLHDTFRETIEEAQANWRKVVGLAAAHGVPTLAMGASLAYFDSCRRAQLPQNLTQAQRDLFGAHTFERVDRPRGESFHIEW